MAQDVDVKKNRAEAKKAFSDAWAVAEKMAAVSEQHAKLAAEFSAALARTVELDDELGVQNAEYTASSDKPGAIGRGAETLAKGERFTVMGRRPKGSKDDSPKVYSIKRKGAPPAKVESV